MTDHQHLRELAHAATPGPWELDSLETGEHGIFIDKERSEAEGLGCGGNRVACFMTEANAHYIAALTPETVLDLLTELEDTRAAYQLTRHQLDAHRAGQGTYEGIER